MNPALTLPVIIPAATTVLGMIVRHRVAQRWTGVAGSFGLLAVSIVLLFQVWLDGIQTVQVADIQAPFGITLIADMFSAVMVVVTGVVAVAISVYSLGTIDEEHEAFYYHPLIHLMLMGVCGAFLTGDIFNMYVWFEVMLMGSFVLMSLGGTRPQIEGSIKYVVINLIASSIFLSAIGVLYGLASTLNMAQLAVRLPESEAQGLVTTIAALFLVAFGIKAAAFPLFFWLPASYQTPPSPLPAIFAALLTKVGIYAMVRVMTLMFPQDIAYFRNVLLVAGALTLFAGVLGAIAQTETRRLLSFLVVSEIGYLLIGLAIFTPASLAATVFFMVHIMLAEAALFLVVGMIHRVYGTTQVAALAGLYAARPALAALFFVPAISLGGIPPLSGFFAKFALLQAGFAAEHYAILAVALSASILTLIALLRPWGVFWQHRDEQAGELSPLAASNIARAAIVTPTTAMVALVILAGVAAGPVFALANRAGDQLADRGTYIRAVLEETP